MKCCSVGGGGTDSECVTWESARDNAMWREIYRAYGSNREVLLGLGLGLGL